MKEVILAVDCITKKKGQNYQEYLTTVKDNKLARKVKIADLTHNSDLSRLKILQKKILIEEINI